MRRRIAASFRSAVLHLARDDRPPSRIRVQIGMFREFVKNRDPARASFSQFLKKTSVACRNDACTKKIFAGTRSERTRARSQALNYSERRLMSKVENYEV